MLPDSTLSQKKYKGSLARPKFLMYPLTSSPSFVSLPLINSFPSISPKGRKQTDLKQLHVYQMLYLSVSKCCRSNLIVYDALSISYSSRGIFLSQPLISLVWTIPITSFYCLPLPSWATFEKCNPFIYGDELTGKP